MGLQGYDDVILRPGVGRILEAAHFGDPLPAIAD
jgi:hypothetical protein